MGEQNHNTIKDIHSLTNLNFSIDNYKDFVHESVSEKQTFAICLINIVNFRYFNYILGYKFSDIVLNMVFLRINDCIDIKDCICRFGGDKLLIIILNNNKEELISITKKIIETIDFPFEIKGKKIRVQINMGISLYPDDSKSVEKILQYAEIALNYSRKITQVPREFFETYMYENVIKNEKIIANIADALKNNEFILYYQPQIDIKAMKVYGMEALIRWNHPDLGIISPAYFMDIIEKSGMMIDVGKFVLYEACKTMKTLGKLGYSNLSMSVNISEKQLEDELFLSFVKDVLFKTGVDPKDICFELTESILLEPTEKLLSVISELRYIGIKIYIDDFGTKYSCLNYLNYIPLDGIKIDRLFIDKIHNHEKEFVITKNIVRLAHELNIEVVAEGVETDEQLKCLSDINCNKIQGFLFKKPVSKSDFVNFLETFKKDYLK